MKPRSAAPTVDQIHADRLTQLANKYWAPHTQKKHEDYDPAVVKDIYKEDLIGTNFSVKRIMMLEFSQYLENYLWPNYDEKASVEHCLSIVLMVNEKFRERVPAWTPFLMRSAQFPGFFNHILRLTLQKTKDEEAENKMEEASEEESDKEEKPRKLSLREQMSLLIFLDHCFTSMEVDIIREEVQKLVSLSMWESLLETRRENVS